VRRFVAPLALLFAPAIARADRPSVAVLWLGDPATLSDGARVADEVNGALARSTARPIDSPDDRRALVEGGAETQAARAQARAEAAFGKLKFAEAAIEYEAAEKLLLSDVPLEAAAKRLGAVERGLLASYDQLGRADDAARAAERLMWAGGNQDDVAPLLKRHLYDRRWQPAQAPVPITSEPTGAQVFRNFQPAGATPTSVAGGDPSLDVLDIIAPGYQRLHMPLAAGGEVRATLVREDRLGALVDQARTQAPDAPAALVAAIGKRVGAARVLVVAPDAPGKLHARWLDVASAKWSNAPVVVDAAGAATGPQLAASVAPAVAAPLPPKAPPPPPAKKEKSAWGKWYTWVAAAAVVALVGGLLIAEHVGDDTLTVTAKH
jgi:hypothetical protein